MENKSASGKRNILVVGKEYRFCSLVEHILELNGYEVDIACDVTGASEQLVAKLPDLIVLDSMMSEAEKLVFMKTVRRLHRYSSIPVVVAISEEAEESQGTALQTGANGAPMKPVLMTELEAAVEEFVPM